MILLNKIFSFCFVATVCLLGLYELFIGSLNIILIEANYNRFDCIDHGEDPAPCVSNIIDMIYFCAMSCIYITIALLSFYTMMTNKMIIFNSIEYDTRSSRLGLKIIFGQILCALFTFWTYIIINNVSVHDGEFERVFWTSASETRFYVIALIILFWTYIGILGLIIMVTLVASICRYFKAKNQDNNAIYFTQLNEPV